MINSQNIYDSAKQILQKSTTKAPIEIAKSLGISVYHRNDLEELLGFYTIVNGIRAIVINNKLDEYMERMVIAHEIGHDILHRDIAKKNMLKEFELFNIKNNTEYEANIFASHLIIDDDTFIELAHDGVDVVSMSNIFGVNVNLVLIKANEMRVLGYDLNLPMDIQKNFLNNINL